MGPKEVMSRNWRLALVCEDLAASHNMLSRLTIVNFVAQVETQLKTKDHDEPKGPEPVQTSSGPAPFITKSNFDEGGLMSFSESDQLPMDGLWDSNALGADLSMEPSSMPSLTSGESTALDDAMSWEMIGLGLEEPLPTQEAIDELYVLRLVSVFESRLTLLQYANIL